MTTDIANNAGNLPAEPNIFIGRERDLEELARMLSEARAVTLCGPGGIGKTRLALRLAAGLAAQFPDGAWLVDLADADRPGLLAPLVARVVGVRQERDQPLAGTLTEALRPRSMLLVMDTCEHLVEACADLALQLLASCPGLRVIATSREPLRIRGEITWRVAPLGLPAGPAGPLGPPLAAGAAAQADPDVEELAGSEAVRLFAARAAAARPGFALDSGNIGAVAAVCRSLDGMPLAIELAAARMRALSPEQIAIRLADRFALLASGNRTAPRRQQTLRATVDWSYDLLTDAEKALLRRLSVFAGWGLEMAEEVCAYSQIAAGEVLELLTALIDKSLVTREGELNGDSRYRLLDTVREYAADQAAAAGETDRLRVAHRDCILHRMERGVDQAYFRADVPWPERLAVYRRGLAEQANTRAALACCADRGDTVEGLRLCIALRPIWLTGGDAADGAAWLDRLLAIEQEVPPDMRGRALSVRAELAFDLQDSARAAEFARAGLGLSQAAGGATSGALRVLALVDLLAGRLDEAMRTAVAAVAAAKAAGDEWETGVTLIVKAGVIAAAGRPDEAQRAFEVALDALGENRGWGRAQAFQGLGQLARARGDAVGALSYFRDALAIYRQIDARSDMSRCLAAIGRLALSQADLPLARTSLGESLRLSLAAGQRLAVARGMEAQAMLAAASGNVAGALMLAGTSQALHEAIGRVPSAGARQRLAALLEAARAQLGPEATAALLDDGRAMNAHAAVQLVTAELASPPGTRLDEPEAVQADQALQTAEPAAAPALEALTVREREVAVLVALGLTNADIASQLNIRPATVARHIANIFVKLEFSSRARLAAWVAANQLRDGH